MFQVNEENHRAEALESVGRGTCDACGEELPMSELKQVAKLEWECKDCAKWKRISLGEDE